MPARLPAPYGVLDSRLGVSGKTESCATCGRKLQDCAGHFGFIKLELPVFHIGFLKATVELLQVSTMLHAPNSKPTLCEASCASPLPQNICKTCSRLLLTDDERKPYLRAMRSPETDSRERSAATGTTIPACSPSDPLPRSSRHDHLLFLLHSPLIV